MKETEKETEIANVKGEERVQKAVGILQQVVESDLTPKNIKKIIMDAINSLNDTSTSLGIRAANSASALEDISQDPNMPSFSRVLIWSAVSALESVRDT